MRPHLFLLPACILSLSSQDAWETAVRPVGGPGLDGQPAWRFLRREGVGRAALFSEELFAARAGAEIRREVHPEATFQALARKLDLTSAPIWVLLDPEGQVRRHGTTEPEAKVLREAMDETGWISRWDRRQAFLKEHPEQGDATLDAVWELERRFLQMRFNLEAQRQKGPALTITWSANDRPDPQMAKALATPFGTAEVVRPCQQALAWFRALPPEDPEGTRAWTGMYALGMGGMASQEALVEEFRGLLRRVEDQLHRDPAQAALWSAWQGLASVLPDVDGEALVAGLEAAPGTPWPLRQTAEAITLHMSPQQRLDRAESELAGGGDPAARVRAWAGIKLGALLALKRDEEARLWILEARRRDREALKDQPLDQWIGGKHPAHAGLKAALEADLPEVKAEGGEGLALVLLGRPDWTAAFEALGRHPELDAWGRGWVMLPGELSLLHFEGREERQLREKLHLPPGPRWVLIRESGELLAQGTRAPDPTGVAQILHKAGTPLLERLEAFLRIHPDHRQAKEKYVEALAERMPHPRLELKLAQACAKVGEAAILRNPDFKPQVPLWEPVARKALVEADGRLERWPESLEAWMAWMDWHSVLPRPSSPTERLRALAVWKSATRGGPGPLPLDVAAGVAARLEQAGRWKDLAEWGLHQWEGGWKFALTWGTTGPEDAGEAEREARQKARKDLLTLIQLTQLALATLGRKADLQRFQEEQRTLDPTLGAGLGRAKP
ncbi:MAG TPA: hypothetical protein VJ623_10675 [Holophagaceae bacterium]|nr:hypothetical protein [Holophagaceae bacterium]